MARIGCRVPSYGPSARTDLADCARAAEGAGADSLWVSDHIVLVNKVDTRYPYNKSGAAPLLDSQAPFFESMTVMAWLASATERVSVGTSVLVLPQRDPVLVAKTAATIDALSGGRVKLGVGAGWMREEFEALGWDFKTRGRRFDEAIEVMRRCWEGDVEPMEGRFFSLPEGMVCRPVPESPEGIPILVGGMSERAIDRAARLGDGWLGVIPLESDDLGPVEAGIARFREGGGSERPKRRIYMRAVGNFEPRKDHLERLERLARLGVDELIIDLDWSDLGSVESTVALAVSAVARGGERWSSGSH